MIIDAVFKESDYILNANFSIVNVDMYGVGYEAGRIAEYDTFWDNYQDNGNLTDYACAFAGKGWTAKTFKPKHKPMRLNSIGSERMFWRFSGKQTEEMTSIDESIVVFSQCTAMNFTFQDSTFDIVRLDCSSTKTMNSTFNMGNGTSYGIREIYIKVTDLCTSFSSTFAYCNNLEKIMFTDDSVIGANISFAQSNKLSHDSLMSIISALKCYSTEKTYSGYFSTPPTDQGWYSYEKIYKITSMNSSDISFIGDDGGTWSVYVTDNSFPMVEVEKATHIIVHSDSSVTFFIPQGSTTHTLTLHKNAKARLTADELEIATAKGWNVS